MASLKYKDENGFWQELPVGGDTEIVGTDGIEVTKGDDGKVTVSGKSFAKKATSLTNIRRVIAIKQNSLDELYMSVDDSSLALNAIPVYRPSSNATACYQNNSLYTGDPKSDYAAANKKYVDDQKNDILTNLPSYHHHLTIMIPSGTIYYDYLDARDLPIEMDSKYNLLPVPDDKLIPLVLLKNGYYSTISGLVYLDTEDAVKVIAHGAIWNGTAMEYINITGETATAISDNVVDIYGR